MLDSGLLQSTGVIDNVWVQGCMINGIDLCNLFD